MKSKGHPNGIIALNCPVRACVIEKGYDACIQCDELANCDKELWIKFPKFHKKVNEMGTDWLPNKHMNNDRKKRISPVDSPKPCFYRFYGQPLNA